MIARRPRFSVGVRRGLAHAHPSLDRLWAMGAETREEALDGISPETEAAMLQALAKIRKNLIAADARAPAEVIDDIAVEARAKRA